MIVKKRNKVMGPATGLQRSAHVLNYNTQLN